MHAASSHHTHSLRRRSDGGGAAAAAAAAAAGVLLAAAGCLVASAGSPLCCEAGWGALDCPGLGFAESVMDISSRASTFCRCSIGKGMAGACHSLGLQLQLQVPASSSCVLLLHACLRSMPLTFAALARRLRRLWRHYSKKTFEGAKTFCRGPRSAQSWRTVGRRPARLAGPPSFSSIYTATPRIVQEAL